MYPAGTRHYQRSANVDTTLLQQDCASWVRALQIRCLSNHAGNEVSAGHDLSLEGLTACHIKFTSF